MPMTRPPYSSGFREQMVELVRSGRSPEELGARATEDAVLAMLDLPLDQHPPEVGAMKVAARCDNRTPAVLAPAVAPKPETGLAGPPNGLQHYSLKMLALSTRRDGPDCVLLLVSEALRHRQVALVDEIKHHYRARAPADAVPLRSRRHARMRLTLPRIHTNGSVGNFTP